MEAQLEVLSNQILTNSEDWEQRLDALVKMQELISNCNDLKVFTPNVWRILKPPLQHTLKDLRSSLVREGCKTLESLVIVVGDEMRPLIRDILPTLIEILGSGNKVIQGFMDECISSIIRHSKFKQHINEFIDQVKNSRSKSLRENCMVYIHQILVDWPPEYLQTVSEVLKDTIKIGLGDASVNARETARSAFVVFHQHWPSQGKSLLKDVDPRLAKQLLQLVDSAINAELEAATQAKNTNIPKESTEVKAAKSIQAVLRGALTRRRSLPQPGSDLPERNSRTDRTMSDNDPSKLQKASSLRPPSVSAFSPPERKSRCKESIGSAIGFGLSRKFSESTNGTLRSHSMKSMSSARESSVGNRSKGSSNLPDPTLEIGQVVNLTTMDGNAIVRFIGETQFASGCWVGVELTVPTGKNDGTVQGVHYFDCPANHGLFVRANQVKVIEDESSQAIQQIRQKMFDLQKEHVQELFKLLEEELGVLAGYEQLSQSANGQQVQAYLAAAEASVEHKNEICNSLHSSIRELKLELRDIEEKQKTTT